jgi:outer membrane receptor protein involved in Fe transport
MRSLKGLLFATCAMAVATPSFAQDAAQDGASAGGLEEIIVTARKREESVQTVPVAVTAISERVIQQRDITSIEKIAGATPNLSVGRASNGSGAQLTMRGIGSSSTSIGIEQSVAVVVDGAYYGQGRVIQEGFFDLKRVEVLKGPQALFFGKNATAGVISLTTNDPGQDREFIARAGYEFRSQQYLGEFIASVPLSDTFGVRLAVRGSMMDKGYYRNVSVNRTYTTVDIQNLLTGGAGNPIGHLALPAAANAPGEDELLGRITLKYTPDDKLTVTVKGMFDHNEVNNSSWNYVAYNCGNANGISQLTGYACGTDFVTHQNNMPVDIAANFPFAKSDGSLYNRYRSWALNGNITYAVNDELTISSVTNYNTNNNRWACACDFQTSNNATWATENSTWRAFSQELRAQTAFDGPINLMIGGLYQKTKREFEQYVAFAGLRDDRAAAANRFVASAKTSFTDGETAALFGQVTWEIVDRLELAGGVRYTHETKDSFFTQPYNNIGVQSIFRDQADPDGLGEITAQQTFNDWSPEVTLTWKPVDDVLVYGAYKTAYKSGGFSNGGINSKFSADPLADLTFNPEKARGFEFGIKSTVLDNQLRLNLGLFSYAYDDLQVDFFNSPIFAFQTLTADARTKGIEVEFEYAPRSLYGLNVHGSVNYTHARYTNFPSAPCYAGQTPAQGCTLVAGAPRQNLNGKPLSVAPEWTGAFGIGYDAAMGNGMKLGLNVDTRYSGAYLASGFGNPFSEQSKYAVLDAGIRFGAEDDNWQIAVIGKNLTNRFFVSGVVDGPSTGGGTGTPGGIRADQLGFGNLPRTVQVTVTKRF